MAQRLIGVRQTCQSGSGPFEAAYLVRSRARESPSWQGVQSAEAGYIGADRLCLSKHSACRRGGPYIACGRAVTMLRHSDGKVRHDGSSAAFMQPVDPVAERGRLHGASGLDARMRNRGIEHRMVHYRRVDEERRWKESHGKYDRLRRQDKRPHIARDDGCLFSMGYPSTLQCSFFACTLCS